MDVGFIVDLQPEANDTEFLVTAPAGGLKHQLRQLRDGDISYIDLDIRSGYTFGRFRIQPGKNIDQESSNPRRYNVSDGFGAFLDENGDISSGPIAFNGQLFDEATHEGTLTGVLTLWKRESPADPGDLITSQEGSSWST